ncbi:hypothetical protein ACP4OV_023478 [Aristida adscensionis]
MRACGGGGAEGWHTGRGLLGGALPPTMATATDPALEAERAHMERVLGATTTVLFAASLSYIALSALYACLCAGTAGVQEPDGDGDGEGGAAEETKRALEEIPIVVVQVVPDGDEHGGAGAEEVATPAPAGECAVCLAEYAGGEEVRELPACRHAFHRECVDRWLLTRVPTCPVCRAPVAAARRGGPSDGKPSAAAGEGTTAASV